MRLNLKRRWKGFQKRSSQYKTAILFWIIGLLFFCFSFFSFSSIASTYRDDKSSFMIETAEELRAVVFLITICLSSGLFIVAALCMWTYSLFLFVSDQDSRIKRIEEFLEEDGVFKFRKDEKE